MRGTSEKKIDAPVGIRPHRSSLGKPFCLSPHYEGFVSLQESRLM